MLSVKQLGFGRREGINVIHVSVKCNKDTTGLVTMNTFSRGHLFFVSSGGIIRYYSPLYKSEGTAQVSIHTIKYLELYIREYKNIDDVFLFYDNMCNLERLKLWDVDKSNLTPNANLGLSVFNAINKGVDALHIKNHSRKECKEHYPDVIKELRNLYSKPNTESAEQTFVWLGKYKKILNSMCKRRHMFYLYCLVIERNNYTVWCYEHGLKPKLPQANRDKVMVAPTD